MFYKGFIIAFVFLICFSGSLWSQQTMFGREQMNTPETENLNLKESDLQKFVQIYEQMVELEAQHNLKIIEIVEEHGMELSRYETISAANRLNFQIDTEAGEMSKYKNIKKAIRENKEQVLQKMDRLFFEHQFDKRKYGQILLKLKADTTFREKIDSLRNQYNSNI